MANPWIFVIHSTEDSEFVAKLEKDLSGVGAHVLSFGSDPLTGKPSHKNALAVMNWRVWLIWVLSRNALASDWLNDDVGIAIGQREQGFIAGLIFVTVEAIDFRTLELLWRRRNYSAYNATADYNMALNRIIALIGLDVATAQQIASENGVTDDIPTFVDMSRHRDLNEPYQRVKQDALLGAEETRGTPQRPQQSQVQQIFISYRRDDSAAGYALHLRADLVRRYGEDKVFMDLGIEPGVDFVDTLENAVGSCAVLLAVIGRNWLTMTDAKSGNRRLDNPEDWVRVEVATALRRNIRVIPMLFHGAHMPGTDDLPDDLKPLARRNALEITDKRWDYDVGSLVTVIDKIVGFTEQEGHAS